MRSSRGPTTGGHLRASRPWKARGGGRDDSSGELIHEGFEVTLQGGKLQPGLEGEHESEVRCVAAPIFDHSGETIAAISVSGPKSRMDPLDKNEELIRLTLNAAQDISAKLGWSF